MSNIRATRETDKALLCENQTTFLDFWVPKSLIHDSSEVYKENDIGTLVMPKWFYEKERKKIDVAVPGGEMEWDADHEDLRDSPEEDNPFGKALRMPGY